MILLDVLMPKMDGITMLNELRKHPEGGNIEVIILSNLDTTSDVAKGMSQGVHIYISKDSIKLEDLLEEIKNKLD